MSQMSRNTGSNVAQSAQYCEQSFKMTTSTHQGYTLGNKSSRWENEAIAQKCATLEQPQWKDDSFTIFHSTSLKKVEPTKKRDTVDNQLHFIAGGLAGCAATTVTCPIDVIKTRQQSSNSVGNPQQTKLSFPSSTPKGSNVRLMTSFARSSLHNTYHSSVAQPSLSVHKGSILQHCRYILQVEGGKAFFKGLGIGLLGSVPS
uniref:Mitochondrial carrier protein n=1 Tax=Ciona savignyi TaxID=51511 RepID=H2ZIV9_CIOSA